VGSNFARLLVRVVGHAVGNGHLCSRRRRTRELSARFELTGVGALRPDNKPEISSRTTEIAG